MGTDAGSVVDPLTMRVHGLDGLRVVDASAMPYVTNGNIYAPVMMLAEKAADLILGEHATARRRPRRSTGTSRGRRGAQHDRRPDQGLAAGQSRPRSRSSGVVG